MTAQPDIIWNEQCLGIRIGEQVCIYLKKHNAEYQRLQKKILELIEKYPVIETFMETNQSISLTEEEHKAVHRYFQLESEKEMIEEEYHFYMGQAQMISYGAMLGKIKKAILGNDDGDTKKLLDFGDYNYEYETYWKEPQTGKILVTDGVENGQDIGTKIYLRGKCSVTAYDLSLIHI